ncbi:MAG: DUF4157 domain-containing protein [Bacteroidota bacterium]|nr:DUF4157 domain-containing protein [Bacteroidota bacterium]
MLKKFGNKNFYSSVIAQDKHSVFFKPIIQPKLTINQPNDIYEQEADSMADKVMRMPINNQPFFSPQPLSISKLQRKCQHCKEEEKMQRKETNSKATVEDASTENYIGSLNGKGKSLTRTERSFFEPRFGYDFSDVQLHTNEEANQSANNVNALAYTNGNNIVFGSNQYQPNTESGQRLMAHELTHVVQQNSQFVNNPSTQNTSVQRETHEGEPTAPTPDNRTAILTWLEQHRFAPPSEQPSTGEQQVLLNGGLMAISQAVDLAVHELHLPREIVSNIISSEAGRSMPISAHGAAYIGGGNQVPGLPLDPHTPEQLLLIAQANELGQIDDWLDNRHFSKLHNPDPLRAMLNDHDFTMEQIADQAIAIVGASSHLSRRDIVVHLRRRYASAPSASGNQWSFQASTGGVLHHYVTPAGSTDPLREWVVQTTAAYTRQLHGANQSGLELQGLIQAQYSITTGQWSVLGGGQATYAIDLSHNLTAGIFAQLLTGAVLTDPLQWQIQPAIGAQIVWQPADWFSIGLQGSGSYTRSFGGPSSLDAGGSFLITISR